MGEALIAGDAAADTLHRQPRAITVRRCGDLVAGQLLTRYTIAQFHERWELRGCSNHKNPQLIVAAWEARIRQAGHTRGARVTRLRRGACPNTKPMQHGVDVIRIYSNQRTTSRR